jgi:dipeptidyl-peptidase 4
LGSGRAVTADDVARYPVPGAAFPASVAFSPDDTTVTWLHSPERTLRRRLFAVDIESGESHEVVGGSGVDESTLSLEEKLRRERARDLGIGITSYSWAKDAARLIVPLPAGVAVLDGLDGELRIVVDANDGPTLDPQLSPDGSMLAFVRDGELHVVPVDGSAVPVPLTSGAEPGLQHGLAEYIAAEEMDRHRGYWWSPDGRLLAFTETDERHIPRYRIVHQGAEATGGEVPFEEHHYPFAGAANAVVRLGVVPVEGGDVVWMQLPDHEYLARVDWLGDGRLAVQVEDRAQRRLELVACDPRTGGATSLLVEESDVWVNLHGHLRPLSDGRFVWASERSGFMHLEVRSGDGSLERTLTEGAWMVTSVDAVSETHVWFTATKESPLERHLYVLPLAGGEIQRLTAEPGMHAAVVDHRHERFVDTFGASGQAPTLLLRSLADGSMVRPLFDDVDPRLDELGLQPPELTTVTTRDGVVLHTAVYRPDGEPPFPTVVLVYGGPHAQMVTAGFRDMVVMRAQYLRGLGFLVLVTDNRGSANRGLEFEAALRWDMGSVEVRDQVDAVEAFVERGLVDPERVGITGWSYGGYMALMCLAQAAQTFKAAVAGAPVTAWDGYDTHYTERYMGLPAENEDGYRRSSVMSHISGIGPDNHLMLVHGLIDENVHFRHTARLLDALVHDRVPAELLLFPGERHSPRSEADRLYMEERIADFFREHLLT